MIILIYIYMGDYGFTFGELSSNSSDDGYGGLFVKFRNNVEINDIPYSSGVKQPAILFDMRTTPIDWSVITSPLLINGTGLAINKTSPPTVGLDIGTSDAIRVPVGSTGDRPSGITGYIRYNSSTNDFEGYKNTGWTSLTQVSLNTSSYDYLSISSGTITLGQIDITADTNLVIGTGLTLSGDTLNVDAAQSGITSVGTLSSLNVDGNVGIGTTSPSCKLHVVDSSSEGKIIIENETLALLQLKQPTSSKTYNIELGRTDGELTFRSTTGERMRLTESGNLGIGTTSPSYKLDVNGTARINSNFFVENGILSITNNGGSLRIYGTGSESESHCYIEMYPNSSSGGRKAWIGYGGGTTTDLGIINDYADGDIILMNGTTSNGVAIGSWAASYKLDVNGTIRSTSSLVVSSDSRIKENIIDVPDNLALQYVRDIPCRYYTYRDTINRGTTQTIGFIAQEVKEVLPNAVDIISDFIPNQYRLLEEGNYYWDVNNLYIQDLNASAGEQYRFFVSDNENANDLTNITRLLEIEANEDGSFTFEKQWKKVFLYGSRVNDFHVLDKQKIFTVHHAAIQELDRINTEQAQRIQTLETQLADVIARLTALENAS